MIKTYTDSVRHTVTLGMAYRCVYCGVIWQRPRDAREHVLICTERTK
jgi:hypothetical protein